MKNQVTIIGGGLAGWASASVFAENGYQVNIYDKQSQNFGSQQISPNGWLALANLIDTVSYTHLRAHETGRNLVCRLLLEKKNTKTNKN